MGNVNIKAIANEFENKTNELLVILNKAMYKDGEETEYYDLLEQQKTELINICARIYSDLY